MFEFCNFWPWDWDSKAQIFWAEKRHHCRHHILHRVGLIKRLREQIVHEPSAQENEMIRFLPPTTSSSNGGLFYSSMLRPKYVDSLRCCCHLMTLLRNTTCVWLGVKTRLSKKYTYVYRLRKEGGTFSRWSEPWNIPNVAAADAPICAFKVNLEKWMFLFSYVNRLLSYKY